MYFTTLSPVPDGAKSKWSRKEKMCSVESTAFSFLSSCGTISGHAALFQIHFLCLSSLPFEARFSKRWCLLHYIWSLSAGAETNFEFSQLLSQTLGSAPGPVHSSIQPPSIAHTFSPENIPVIYYCFQWTVRIFLGFHFSHEDHNFQSGTPSNGWSA